MRKCPNCGSMKAIQTERRPNGDSKCLDCGHKGPTKTFDIPVEKPKNNLDSNLKQD